MLGSDYPKIHARHSEAPVRPFLCERHPAAYRRPDRVALDRYSNEGRFDSYDAIETFDAALRRLLAETESANVVRLPVRRSP